MYQTQGNPTALRRTVGVMRKRIDTPLPGLENRGFMRRIGGRAAFVVGSIGLVFAAFQVQGWTMPRPLAIALITVLLVAAAVALLSILWEAIEEARRWREGREVNVRSWCKTAPRSTGELSYGSRSKGVPGAALFERSSVSRGPLCLLGRDELREGERVALDQPEDRVAEPERVLAVVPAERGLIQIGGQVLDAELVVRAAENAKRLRRALLSLDRERQLLDGRDYVTELVENLAALDALAAAAGEVDTLRALLIEVQVEELNGRLCPRPESHKDRCCPVCRDLWRRIDEALAPAAAAASPATPEKETS